jgi:predicted PurR-regulated permease PerM
VSRPPQDAAAGRSLAPRPPAREGIGADRVLLLALAGVFVWLVGDVLLMVFTGILVAVGLDGLARALAERTPLKRGLALVVVGVAASATLVGLGVLIVPRVTGQIDQLWSLIINAVESGRAAISRWGWPEQLVDLEDGSGQDRLMDFAGSLAGRVAGMTMAAIGIVGGFFVVITIAIFAAADPGLYRRGFLALLPSGGRRWDAALSSVGHSLRWWFFGQLVSMAVLGVTVSVGLWLLGVDLWLSLGVLTALLTFIPVLGPIIAGVPILIVAFSEGTGTGLAVLAFYLVVQNLEGNILVPYIQQRAAHLPPVLLISVQIMFGALFGIAGFILAAPLTVVGMVLVRELWVAPRQGT